jgi:hypothetical protein
MPPDTQDPLASMPDTLAGQQTPPAPKTPFTPKHDSERFGSQSSEEVVQQESGIHPFKSPTAQAAMGPVRAVWGMVRSPYDLYKAAFTPPTTSEEQAAAGYGGKFGVLLDRMFVHPAIQAHETGKEMREGARTTRAVAQNIEAAANDPEKLKALQKQYPQYDLSTPAKALLAANGINRDAIFQFSSSLPAELGALPIVGSMGQGAGTRMAAGDVPGAVTESLTNAIMVGRPKTTGEITGAVTKPLAKGAISHLIKPLKGDMLFGKDPAAGVLDNGIFAWSLHGLGEKVTAKLQEVGKNIDREAQKYSTGPPNVDVSSFMKPIDDAIRQAAVASDQGLLKRLIEERQELLTKTRVTFQGTAKPVVTTAGTRGLMMTPYEALKFKRIIGDRVRWMDPTIDRFQDQVNRALGSSYKNVDTALDTAVPGLRPLNEQYSNLVGAAKAIQRRIPIAERNAHWSLTDVALGTHSIPMAVARKVGMLPIVRTVGANIGTRIPKAIPAATVGAVTAESARDQKRRPERLPKLPPPPPPPDPLSQMPDTLAQSGSAPQTLADAISSKEGFGTPLAVPTLANNPGALELGDVGHGTMQAANNQRITIFGTLAEGKAALDKQLNLILSGKDPKYPPNMTLEEFGKKYSGGDTGYGAHVAAALGVDPSTTLGELAQKTSGAAPLPAMKAEVAAKKPSAAIRAKSQPSKSYSYTATGPNNHKIGTDDGVTWFDIQTGQQLGQ